MGDTRAGVHPGVVAGCALGVASGWNIGDVGAVASDLARAYHVGLATVGIMTTALFLTHVAVQVPGGRASDRFGARRAGVVAILLIAAGNLLATAAPEAALAIVARAITGLGTGLAFISGSAIVRQSGGSPFAQGVFGGIALGAAGAALAVVPQFEPVLGWRSPYLTALGVAAVALVLLALLAPRAPAKVRDRPLHLRPARTMGDRRLLRLAALYSASYGLSVVVGNWVVEILQRHSTLADGQAAVVGALTLLLGVVTRPLGGWIMRRHPRYTRLAVALGIAAGGGGTLALLTAQPLWLAVAGSLLVGIGAGIPFSPAFEAAAATRPDAPAAAVGVVNAVANAVVLVGTPLVGVTFSLAGDGRIGFAVIAALWFASLAVLPASSAFAPAVRGSV